MQIDFLLLQAITAEHKARTGHRPHDILDGHRKPYMVTCDVCLNLCGAWKCFENWRSEPMNDQLRETTT